MMGKKMTTSEEIEEEEEVDRRSTIAGSIEEEGETEDQRLRDLNLELMEKMKASMSMVVLMGKEAGNREDLREEEDLPEEKEIEKEARDLPAVKEEEIEDREEDLRAMTMKARTTRMLKLLLEKQRIGNVFHFNSY
jgi:hypothetical protein